MEIRSLVAADIDFAVSQTEREGWATARSLFETYLEHDPEGGFVAWDGVTPVGMVTTCRYSATAWVGNLIVLPAHRSRGIGRALMVHALDRLRGVGVRTVRLDADPPGISLYRSLGFVDESESCRYRGQAPATGLAAPEKVEALGDDLLGEVAVLDCLAFGDDRSRLLRLLRRRASSALVLRGDHAVAGYLLMEPTLRGHRVGPCVATTEETARSLLQAALARVPGCQVVLGIPGPNHRGRRLLAAMGFQPTPSSIRMVLGPAVAGGRPEDVFAIAGGAVG